MNKENGFVMFFKSFATTMLVLSVISTAVYIINKERVRDYDVIQEFTYAKESDFQDSYMCLISDFDSYGKEYLKEYDDLLSELIYGYDYKDIDFSNESYLSSCETISYMVDLTKENNRAYINKDFIEFIKNNSQIKFLFPADIYIDKDIKKELLTFENVDFLTIGYYTYQGNELILEPENKTATKVILEIRNNYPTEFTVSPDEMAVIYYSSVYLKNKGNIYFEHQKKLLKDNKSNYKLDVIFLEMFYKKKKNIL